MILMTTSVPFHAGGAGGDVGEMVEEVLCPAGE